MTASGGKKESRSGVSQYYPSSVFRFFAIAVMSSLMVSSTGSIEIVTDAKPATAIVISDTAFPVVVYAADELQYHIQKATTAKLQIVRENKKPDSFRGWIYLGNCRATAAQGIDLDNLPPAGFIMKTLGDSLYLAGRDNDRKVGSHAQCTWHGTLWAVYEFLEKQMNVCWLWPGELGEVIPSTDNISITSLNQMGTPNFQSTKWSVQGRSEEVGWSSVQARDKFFNDQDKWLLRHRFAATKCLSYGHKFGNYWERFRKTHPEFFNLLPNGKREPLPGDATGHNITMCVSQPMLWKQIVSEWQQDPSRNPDHIPCRPYLCACENDSPGMCTCPTCRAWDQPDYRFQSSPYWGQGKIPTRKERFHGLGVGIAGYSAPWGGTVVPEDAPSLSDRYARFYLAVQTEAKKVDPNVVVFGYAYANYWHAPEKTRLNENIIISYVPPLWFPYTKTMSQYFRKNWDGWQATGATMLLRPNLTHAGHNMPIFYASRLADDFSYAAARGMIGASFDSLLGAWSTQGQTLYVLARLQLHPHWPAQRILDEYYRGFGPAEPEVRKYFEYWQKVSDAITLADIKRYNLEEGGGGFKNYVLITDRMFPPEIMAQGKKLLDRALQAAQQDKLSTQRVKFLEMGLRDAELTLISLKAHKKYNLNPSKPNQNACRQALKELIRHRAACEPFNVGNFGYWTYREQRGAKWLYSSIYKQ